MIFLRFGKEWILMTENQNLVLLAPINGTFLKIFLVKPNFPKEQS